MFLMNYLLICFLFCFISGKYCERYGLENVTGLCDAGYFCTSGASIKAPTDGITGNICPTGRYCPEGTSVPRLCPLGTYSNRTRNKAPNDCVQCEPGQYCADNGLEKPTGPCDAGYYCPGGQNSSHPVEYKYVFYFQFILFVYSVSSVSCSPSSAEITLKRQSWMPFTTELMPFRITRNFVKTEDTL